MFISGDEVKPGEGDPHLSPEPSPDDLSSPNPDHATPLLQAQQRPPSRVGRDATRPGSENGSRKMDAEVTETAAAQERADDEDSLAVADREELERERMAEKDSEQDRTEDEKEYEDKKDGDDVDEGLPLSKGSEDENEEESEGQKEPPDANNNSLETPQECQDELIDIPDLSPQVGLKLRCEQMCLCNNHRDHFVHHE